MNTLRICHTYGAEFEADFISGHEAVCPSCSTAALPIDYLARAKETAHYGNHEQATAYALIAIAEELRAMRLNT